MRRRFRVRKLLKWLGTVVCVLMVLMALVGLRGQAFDLNFGFRFGVRFIAGLVNVVVRITAAQNVQREFSTWVSPAPSTWKESADAWLTLGLKPRFNSHDDGS